jgi:hypothetical protein
MPAELIAIPEPAFRSGSLHIALLVCGHRILIDGEFTVVDGRVRWFADPGWVTLTCPDCEIALAPPYPYNLADPRIVQVWRVE